VRPGESADKVTAVAPEFQSGSITSQSLGEGQGGVIPGADDQDPAARLRRARTWAYLGALDAAFNWFIKQLL